jgi:hypothetical protein
MDDMIEFDAGEHSDTEERCLPASASADKVIGRSRDAAVQLIDVRCYPGEWSFTIRALRRVYDEGLSGVLDADEDGDSSDLRISLEFSDGQVVDVGNSTSGGRRGPRYTMASGGGSGSGFLSESDFVCRPLPSPGTIVIRCRWPSHGINDARAEISADLIIEAASRAVVLWTPDEMEGVMTGHSWISASIRVVDERSTFSRLFGRLRGGR